MQDGLEIMGALYLCAGIVNSAVELTGAWRDLHGKDRERHLSDIYRSQPHLWDGMSARGQAAFVSLVMVAFAVWCVIAWPWGLADRIAGGGRK